MTSPKPILGSTGWRWEKKGRGEGGDPQLFLFSLHFFQQGTAGERAVSYPCWSNRMVVSQQISGCKHREWSLGVDGRQAAERGLQGSEDFRRMYQRFTRSSSESDNHWRIKLKGDLVKSHNIGRTFAFNARLREVIPIGLVSEDHIRLHVALDIKKQKPETTRRTNSAHGKLVITPGDNWLTNRTHQH